MSLSTTAAAELQVIAEGLPGLQEVLLCYGEMADAAAGAAGWSALPLRSLDFRAVEGCVSASTLEQLGKLQHLIKLDVYGKPGYQQWAAGHLANGLSSDSAAMHNIPSSPCMP